MRLLDVTDDTVNVQKSLLEELRSVTAKVQYSATGEELEASLLPPLVAIALHKFGHRVLVRLLQPTAQEEGSFYIENSCCLIYAN